MSSGTGAPDNCCFAYATWSTFAHLTTRQQTNPRPLTWGFIVERVTRIELALSAWEADVLPLNYTRVRQPPEEIREDPEAVSDRLVTVPHHRPPALTPWGLSGFQGVGSGCRGPELGRTVEGRERGWAGSECRLEGRPFDPVMWPLVVRQAAARRGSWGRDSWT